jgi:DNA-binding CsgD family transcriptional regulator
MLRSAQTADTPKNSAVLRLALTQQPNYEILYLQFLAVNTGGLQNNENK